MISVNKINIVEVQILNIAFLKNKTFVAKTIQK